MPPRTSSSSSLQTCCSTFARLSLQPPSRPTSLSTASHPSSTQSSTLLLDTSCPSIGRRNFSTSSSCLYVRRTTKLRARMNDWLQKHGAKLRTPDPNNRVQYLFNENRKQFQPFPKNPAFVSESVLSESARELIWEKVMKQGESLKTVSAELGVDLRRVGAVVRMKEMEKDWIAKGKKLAIPYSKAVLSMVPTHSYGRYYSPLESISEIHVHSYTQQQLFVPTPDSKQFTRADAAKAFHDTMLPADKRVQHPELIEMEREIANGADEAESFDRFREKAEAFERKEAEKHARKAEQEEKSLQRVETGRFEFRFKDYNVDQVGTNGRSRSGVGWRYGVPYEDRRKGHAKLKTKVE